jgi:formate hydrogenlyase transcriptional activator
MAPDATVALGKGLKPLQFVSAGSDNTGRIERLANRLSTALLHLDMQHFDTFVEDALHQIVDALDMDVAILAQFAEGPTSVSALACWTRPELPALDLRALRQAPWLLATASGATPLALERFPDDLPPESRRDRAALRDQPIKSLLTIPVTVGGRQACAFSVGTIRDSCRWPMTVIQSTQHLAEMLGAAVHRRQQEQALHRAGAEVTRLSAQLESENLYLTGEIATLHEFDEIIGDSPALREALARVQDVAATDSTVLLLGETGTGKELFARAVHERSDRKPRPLVRVNCAALPASLIESELFGHERGAFTGAVSMRQGRFELADRGTIFLDEIGDLPLDVQGKLLRVLQEGEFERLGSSHTRKVNVRVIAATHRDLESGVEEGRFRADLYYRLSVFPIRLPPLRERRDDIERLVWFVIHRRQRPLHRQIKKVPEAVMATLRNYGWPGNVRELENVVERAMIRSTGDILFLDQSLGPVTYRENGARGHTLHDVERKHIEDMLHRCGWRINGPGNAAEQLALHPNTLRFRMRKLGILRP